MIRFFKIMFGLIVFFAGVCIALGVPFFCMPFWLSFPIGLIGLAAILTWWPRYIVWFEKVLSPP